MRLAFSLRAINAAAPAPSSYLELAKAAERHGYETIWAPEIRSTDPFTLLGWIGSHTSTIGLGCGVAQVTGRTAVTMAASAVTLDGLSGGRFNLGLGVSGPQIVQGWHGRPFARPLAHLRDYLAVLRLALGGEPISYAGEEISLPAVTGSEQVEPLRFPVPPSRVPIHLAALGPKAVALAGELADGWIAINCPPEYLAAGRSWLREGAARAGRSLDGFTTSAMVTCCVDEDAELARDIVRPTLAVYLGGMGTSTTNFYNRLAVRLGFADAAAAAREAYQAGDIGQAIAAVDDKLVDTMTLCGPEDYVRDRLAQYQAAGVDVVVVGLAGPSVRTQLRQLEVLGELARG